MNQLAIEFDAAQVSPGAAVDAAVLGVLSDGPRRSLQILIALWHEYSWDGDVAPAIERLLTAGKITLMGTTRPPEGWNPMNGRPVIDEIYGIKGGAQ